MKDYFKFIIKLPKEHACDLYQYQTAVITTQAPILYIRWEFRPGLDPKEQIRLAKSELKLAMIDALINGEWEIEKD